MPWLRHAAPPLPGWKILVLMVSVDENGAQTQTALESVRGLAFALRMRGGVLLCGMS